MRFHLVLALGILSVATVSAAGVAIQVGGTAGLTFNYITQGAGAVCAAGAGNCVTGNFGTGNTSAPGVGTTGFVEKNYDVRLFQNATNSTTSPTTPVPYAGYNQTSQWTSGGTLGVYSMIQDGSAGGNSNNFWDALSANTMLIPVGISNVLDVRTLMDNIWGPEGATDTVVTFNFGSTSNASIFNDIVVVNLQNSGTAGSSPSGQIGSTVDCTTAVPCGTSNSPNGSASGPLLLGGTPPTTLSTDNGGTFNAASLTVNAAVLADNMFGGTTNSYTNIPLGSYAGTTGVMTLDAQKFLLSGLVAPNPNEYLVSIVVKELSGATPVSQTALSAITVDQATPEPSTVFLFLTGIGALGLARFRRQ